MYELDMYEPIKDYLTNLGYIVQAEVKNVDILAKKAESIIVVEMKTKLSFKHLYQGCDRQRMFDNVYLAILDPGIKKRKEKAFKEKMHILKRLGLGMMVVDDEKDIVEVLLNPKEFKFRRNIKNQKLLLKEFSDRKLQENIGGVNRTKIMTAYREQVIEVAKVLIDGAKTTKEIRKITKVEKTTSILYKNYYGWFVKINRGEYALSLKGKLELMEYI